MSIKYVQSPFRVHRVTRGTFADHAPLSWVMLDGSQGFVRLPGERIIHKSSPRISLALTTPTTYPGNNPVAIHCSSGVTYLTNQRVRIPASLRAPSFLY